MTPVECDPSRILQGLQFQRRLGRSFDEAWRVVAGDASNDRFMMKHFRAAYNNWPGSLGRFSIPEPSAGGVVERPARNSGATSRSTARTVRTCQSSVEGGCSKQPTHGTFGKRFCRAHYDELMRIRGET